MIKENKMTILKAKNFILRHTILKDLTGFYETETDRISKKMFMSYPKNINEAKQNILEDINDNKKKPTLNETFSIVVNDCYAGYVKIQHQNFDLKSKDGRIHVAVHPAFRGKGLATQAINAITEYGFKKYKFRRILAQCKYINKAVCNALKKAGFKVEKIHTVDGFKKILWVKEREN